MNSGVDEPPGVQNLSRCPDRMPPGQLQQLPQRGAERRLVLARLGDVPGQGEDPEALGPLGAVGREVRGPAVEDVRHGRDGLDVVDHRGAGVQPGHRRERRLQPGLAAEALQRVQQRGLLAADIGARPGVHDHLEVEPGTEDVGAQVTGLVGLGHGEVQPADHVQHLAAHVDEGPVRVDGVAGDHDALDQRLRVVQQGRHVFAGPGLRLVGVHHQVVRLVAALRDEPPLQAGGEAGPAAAAQHGVLHGLHDLVRLQGQGLGQGAVPAVALVAPRG